MQSKARIISLGAWLPERVLTNADLEQMVETNDDWIVSRTGIRERRIAGAHDFPSTMGAAAAREAVGRSGRSIEQVDLIIVATSTPDFMFPSTAALIQRLLGAPPIPALDIQAACTGFLYGLEMAKSYIQSGIYRNILVIATEKLSAIVDYQDRTTCVLFGDGAAAAWVSDQGAGLFLNETSLGSDGEVAELLQVPAGGSRSPSSLDTVFNRQHYIKMEGQEVFKHAVRRMEQAAKACLHKAQLDQSAINWMIPHQANARIIDAMGKRFDIDPQRVIKTLHKYGNTSASGLGIALYELWMANKIEQHDHILLVAFGAGFTWGAVLLTCQVDDGI